MSAYQHLGQVVVHNNSLAVSENRNFLNHFLTNLSKIYRPNQTFYVPDSILAGLGQFYPLISHTVFGGRLGSGSIRACTPKCDVVCGVQPLRRALSRMGVANLVPDQMDNCLSYSVVSYLKKLKNQVRVHIVFKEEPGGECF